MERIQLDSESWMTYQQNFLADDMGMSYMDFLINALDWQQEPIFLFGRKHLQPRLTAWLGMGFSAYSKYSESMPAAPWDQDSLLIKQRVEEAASCRFNSALVNYYRDGHDSMGFHADDEPALGIHPTIASLSLGEERDFSVKQKQSGKTCVKMTLHHGSLLIMGGAMQAHYKHGINKSKRQLGPRVNLTFRRMSP